jgi:hypothetical protein
MAHVKLASSVWWWQYNRKRLAVSKWLKSSRLFPEPVNVFLIITRGVNLG